VPNTCKTLNPQVKPPSQTPESTITTPTLTKPTTQLRPQRLNHSPRLPRPNQRRSSEESHPRQHQSPNCQRRKNPRLAPRHGFLRLREILQQRIPLQPLTPRRPACQHSHLDNRICLRRRSQADADGQRCVDILLARLCLPALERTVERDGKLMQLTVVGSNAHAFAASGSLTALPKGEVFDRLSDEKEAEMGGWYFLSKLLVHLCAQGHGLRVARYANRSR
jgi:hypothetical protein